MVLKISEDEKRRKHRSYCSDFEKINEKRKDLLEKWCQNKKVDWGDKIMHSLPAYPAYPEECLGLTCGAKTRKGTPCKRKDLYACGRCRLHGGLSTGPKTSEGKKRASLNGFKAKTDTIPKPRTAGTKNES
jgi:hypothetical protein